MHAFLEWNTDDAQKSSPLTVILFMLCRCADCCAAPNASLHEHTAVVQLSFCPIRSVASPAAIQSASYNGLCSAGTNNNILALSEQLLIAEEFGMHRV